MAIYNLFDVKSDLAGDLSVNSKGDIDIGSSIDTYRSAVNFLIKTDHGDYAPNNRIGCSLGSFIGLRNSQETHERMQSNMVFTLGKILSPEDFRCIVVPISTTEAAGYVFLAGTYLIDNEYRKFDKERVTFSFPYMVGNPTDIFNTR